MQPWLWLVIMATREQMLKFLFGCKMEAVSIPHKSLVLTLELVYLLWMACVLLYLVEK